MKMLSKPACLSVILLMIGSFVACSSGSSDDSGPVDVTTPGTSGGAMSSSSSSSSSSSGGVGTPPADNQVLGSDGSLIYVNVEPSSTDVQASSSVSITLAFVDENDQPAAVPGTWAAVSPCSTASTADIEPISVAPTSVTFQYTANGCIGADLVTFSGRDGGVSYITSTSLTVEADQVSFIQWVGTEPSQIAIRGTGGQENATVTFRAQGLSGEPIAGVELDFRIEGSAGGLSLADASGVTNSDGLVTARVLAGTTPTVVTIVARHEPSGEETPSGALVVSTGLASDSGFNISLSIFNPKAWSRINDQATNVTVAVTDRSGNPVADGTIVNFVSEEGGSVTDSCVTVNNTCTVEWKPNGRQPDDGRAKIFASVKGTEDFIDNNGNKIFDDGDTFNTSAPNLHDLPEPYSDNNDNGMYDLGEHFVDTNGNGTWDIADGLWNGLGCAHSSLCATDSTFVDLGEQQDVVLSDIAVTICDPGNFTSPLSVSAGGFANYNLFLSDGNTNAQNDQGDPCPLGNPLPNGTTVAWEGDGVTVSSTNNPTVDNTYRPTFHGVTIKGPSAAGAGLLTMTVTVPGESPIKFSWSVSVEEPAE